MILYFLKKEYVPYYFEKYSFLRVILQRMICKVILKRDKEENIACVCQNEINSKELLGCDFCRRY